MSTATVTCGNCRHELAATALFCPHCGRPKVRDDGDALLGKVLGDRFLVQERLGQGASGTIYRAEHVTLRRRVALKVLHHELSRDDLALERFRREATTVADIDNEHIVEIHDFGRTVDGRLYLAMELLEGETLDAVLAREGRLPIERVVDVMTQVGEALIEAHAIGYVHRDLRPRNLMLAVRRGRANFVKLLDFGLAKLVESEGQAASTSLGMTFGDPRYMSPEQARGDAIDRRADVYQLGCVAYEMLTGAPPFVGGRVFDVLSRHVSEAPAPVSRARPDVPPWLEATVTRMLAKRPEDRFATMTRMVEALRQGEATGAIMTDTTARHAETVPPPSVSRVMEKLGRTQLGPHGEGEGPGEGGGEGARDGDAAAAPVAPAAEGDSAATLAMKRVGPRGTPKVGVPVVPAAPVASAPVASAPVPAPAAAAPSAPVAGTSDAGMWSRPARGDEVSSLVAPADASGKHPAGARAKRPSAGDSAGISSVWYADGEALDGGAELDERQAARLERARALITPGSGDTLSEGYVPRRPIGKLVAIGAGAALLLALAIVVIAGGSSGSKAESAGAGAGAAGGADVGPAVGVAAGADPGAAAPAEDAGVAAAPPPDAAVATAKKPEPREPREPRTGGNAVRREREDPVDVRPPDRGEVDEESRAKAEFFAKAGEGQLRNGDAQGAAASFKKALELDPRNLAAVIGLGEVAMQQGLYDAAIAHLKKAAKLAPRSSRIHTLLGESYLNSGNNKAAEAAFKKALQIDPDNARARDGYNEAASRLPPPKDDF